MNNMCKCKWWCALYFVIVYVAVTSSYNVETVNFNKYTKSGGDLMFGFSVAAHKERGYNWILVGAPKAQTHQPGVERGGAVFKCSAQWNDTCQEVLFDRSGDNINTQGLRIDQKSGQWFGATLHSAGADGPIVACAPRYVWYPAKRTRRDPVGTCYVAKNDFRDVSEYSPCRTSQWGYHRQGSCQAGFSAAISKDGKRLFVGAPGSWYWQGQMYSIDANSKFPFTPGIFRGVFGSGQVIQQSLENRPAVIQTSESAEIDDDSYMGYSMTVGDFTGEGVQGSAVGMPRGNQLLGKIVLYTWNLTNFRNISGLQMGAYFGYAVASSDIDGDGRDDLLIGAPLHTEANNEGKYEVGRVYLVYQRSSEGAFRRLEQLDGFKSKSRFGLSVASLGDINLDGYGDFAVGAPYDGVHGRGVVYIFHGSKTRVEKHTQAIHAEEVSGYLQPPVETFGFSLTGGVDLDDNDYPDTVVGAYLSNTVFYFRSRPVVKVEGSTTFLIDVRDQKKEIVIEQKNCTLKNRKAVACTTLDTCFKFHGQGVPRDVELEIQYVLDVQKPTSPRMYFLNWPKQSTINETVLLRKGEEFSCTQKIVFIKPDIRDKLTPIEAEVRYSMRQRRHAQNFQELLPILDFSAPPVRKDIITVHKNCGQDNVCIPDLRMQIRPNVASYLLGSDGKLELDVIVENAEEDSFETTFDVQFPEGVGFNKAIESDKNEVIISCSEVNNQNNTVRCEIGNPLPSNKIVRFKLEFKPYRREGMKPSFDFYMTVNSTNPELNSTVADNTLTLKLPISINAKLELGGNSRYAEVPYNKSYYSATTIKRESDIGPEIIHTYSIQNKGPSDIKEAEMLFIWPYATEGGEDLLYLLDQPHTIGDVRCEMADANYRGYDLDYSAKTIWEKLQIDVSKGDVDERKSTKTVGKNGVLIEEGFVTTGISSDKLKPQLGSSDSGAESTGDASLDHEQRYKSKHEKAESGQAVLVTQDRGGGSKVQTVTKTTYWNTSSSSNEPGVTKIYTKNTTTHSGNGGDVSQTQEQHRVIGGNVRPNIIYTSSVQRGQQQSGTQSQGFSGSAGGSSATSSRGGTEDFSVSGHYGGSQEGYSSQEFAQEIPNPNIISTGQSGRNRSTYGVYHKSEGDFSKQGIGGAALGTGFKVSGIELETIGSNANVDESVSQEANRQFESSSGQGQGRYDPDLGRVVYDSQGRTGGGSIIYSSGGSRVQSSKQFHTGPSHWQTHYSSQENSQPAARDNVPTETPNLHNRFVGRRKRQIVNRSDIKIEDVIQCKATRCKHFKCTVGPMKKDQDAFVVLRSRINVHTLHNITSSQSISLSTMMLARISKVPYIGSSLQKDIYSHEVFTTIPAPEPDTKPDIVPLWVVVLSAVAGAIILLLLIFLLYKCGFFKRNRPSDAPERQPLNRNGHYHSGDEAL